MSAIHNSQWAVATFNKPIMFTRSDDETWLLNPPRRYVLNVDTLNNLQSYVSSLSDLGSGSLYHPLVQGVNLPGARVLVERYRERGIGDLLFMTGPLSYLNHVTGGKVKIDMYALAERGQVLSHHPSLHLGTTLAGPLHYDDFGLYDYQWMADTVTEYDEERDQLNVYDALFKQIGVDPGTVDNKFKRPSAYLVDSDLTALDSFYYWVFTSQKVDLRKTGYYVVAPFSVSSLRSMPYGIWLEIIEELARNRPVVIVGHMHDRIPVMDMSSGEFFEGCKKIQGQVINAVGSTPIRLMMAIMAKASAAVCLDSGTLYVAQAFRTPAVSIWGTHNPGVRIGYDQDYMDLAVWNHRACRYSPCHAYCNFPTHKCPRGVNQHACEVLATVDVNEVVSKIELTESIQRPVGPFTPVK